MTRFSLTPVAGASLALALCAAPAQAASVEFGPFSGNLDSSVSTGVGIRTQAPSPSLILQGNTGGPTGQASMFSGLGDQGTLNYDRGDPFTLYLKGSHELLLKGPSDITIMARANWLRDFAATRTTGWNSVSSSPSNVSFDASSYSGGLMKPAREDLRFKARLLDLWVSKSFEIGEQRARLRVGQQVISWGESLFATGGINAANPADVMRLSQPGTQLKEGILPTPAVSLASGLGNGFNIEAYVQTQWKGNYMPPTGSYWSLVNGLGKGQEQYGFTERKPGNGGQYGVALKYRPSGTSLDLGLYALSYHDKAPQLNFTTMALPDGTVVPATQFYTYPAHRKLIGLSANFPVGDWAVGTELSYRPKEAVMLNPNLSFCSSQGGRCYVDEKKLQWHLTGFLSLSPSNAGPLLDLLGADGGNVLTELVVMHFPQLKKEYGGDIIAAGGWSWGNEQLPIPQAMPLATGTKTSSGLSVDFSWTYDGSLIPGWQVTPEVFVSWGLHGRTPTLQGNYMQGARSVNYILTFTRNPATWQLGLNYARFSGGKSVLDQPLGDRDFVGAYATFNF